MIAGSVASVLLVSGAVALAVANGDSPAPQPRHTDAALGIGTAASGPGTAPLVTLSAGPATSAATATPTASAAATPTASATASRRATTSPTKAAPTAGSTPSVTPVVNFALHAAVSVSSTVNTEAQWVPANLTNGVFSSSSTDQGWSSVGSKTAASTQWVSLKLSSTATIAEVNLYPRDFSGAPTCFPTAFTIAVSTDGTHWTTVITKSGYTATSLSAQRFYFKSVSARYIKVTATSLTADEYKNYYLQLLQISAY